MKICVISAQVFAVPPSGYSGLEQIAWVLSKGLAERGHEVTLIAPTGSTCPGVRVIDSGPPGQWHEQQAYSTYWQHLPAFDAVVDHSWQKWAYILKTEGKLGAPVLGVCHAPVNTMYGSLPGVERPCFVCISKDQAAHFEALHGRPARVCYNGVDTSFYKATGVRRTDRFLFLARFSTIKGADLAIQACKEAGVGLDLVGDTSITGEPEFFEKCKAMADGKQIRIVGPASRGECVSWFSQAHCLLHPNLRFREPFGLAPVEALLCGCPVVAWDFGALRETVKPLETGLLVNSSEGLAHAVRQVAEHPNGGHAAFDRARCREWAMQFSVENMVTSYEDRVREAIETGGW